jgi:NAD(P)-dependent dehydrogenase (short-subunit alcohol dehydrogenase family)
MSTLVLDTPVLVSTGAPTLFPETDMANAYDFRGQTILITGGAGILGAGMVEGLVACGANVAVLDRNPDALKGMTARFPAHRDRGFVYPVVGDVLNPESIALAVETVLDEFGTIDALVNGAGGNNPKATAGGPLSGGDTSFFDLPPDALRWVFDLNLMGTILPSQAVGRHMAARGRGVILNISSMNAFRPLTRVVAYSAAKAGVSNFTQWLAVHMAQEYSAAIRVNALAPGFFLTEQNRYLLTDRDTGLLTERGRQILGHTPMNRYGAPQDLIGPMLWLLSPASAFVTGIVVPVDGGFSAFSGV